MRHYIAWILVVLIAWAVPAKAVELTGMTIFECNGQGMVNVAHRYNAGPIDAAWDLFVYEGDVFDPATMKPDEIKWLNNEQDHAIRIPLSPGTHTFTIHAEHRESWPITGLNLFFSDKEESPGISAMAAMDTAGPPFPAFSANPAEVTMGLPVTDIAGAGTLTYQNEATGFWAITESDISYRVTLESFHFSTPAVNANLDLVGTHSIGASGAPDFTGQFVLKVEEYMPRPDELLLWLGTQAAMTLGGPDRRARWKTDFGGTRIKAPFSFQYGGVSSEDVLARCVRKAVGEPLDANRNACTISYTDPETGLEIRWEGVEYCDFKTVEWTVYFKNTGSKNTPILSNIQGLDVNWRRGADHEFTLFYNRGDSCTAESFEPLVNELAPGEALRFAPTGGRGTNFEFPYYNLRTGSEGAIIAVGWPGQWASSFTRDEERSIHVEAGQERTHLTLHPSEEVRTPLIVVQFTKDNEWLDGQNTWRQWMIKYNIPKPDGKLIEPPLFAACSSHQFAEMTKANEQNQIEFIDSYLAKGLKIDYWWMDAGWYTGAAEKGWPWTGSWEVDRRPHRFPNGLRAVSDHAHEKGVEIIVWFEPERVASGTWLATEHPEWVFGGTGGGLLNLGDPEARDWLVNHIDKIITDEGIDFYRQDYNIDPLHFWRENDTEDRQGITENKYVMGYLAYWDELLRRHPGMLIDSCASGGRRNDLETMRRAVPFLRSDYLFEPIGQQGHTYALSSWLPINGTGYNPSNTVGWGYGTGGAISYDPYTRRSNMTSANIGCFDFRVAVDDELILKLYREWREIGPCYLGNYYPLTSYSLSEDVWMAWQFDLPERGEGMVQAFRRKENIYYGGTFTLKGLEAEALYEITNADVPGTTQMTGKQLMEQGLDIRIDTLPGAALFRYKKVD